SSHLASLHGALHCPPTRRPSDLAHSIVPASDALGVFPALLQHLRDFRIRAKRLARETAEPAERAHLGALSRFGRLPGESLGANPDRKSTRLNSTHDQTSHAVFCL